MSSIPTSVAAGKSLQAAGPGIALKFQQSKSLQHGSDVLAGQDHHPHKPASSQDASLTKALKEQSKENFCNVLIPSSPPKSPGHPTNSPLEVNVKETKISKSSFYSGGLLLQRLHRTPSPPKSKTVPLSVPMGNLSPKITSPPRFQEISEDHDSPISGHIIKPTHDPSQTSSMDSIDELLLSPSHLNINTQAHEAGTATHSTVLPKVAISDGRSINSNDLKFAQNVKKPISPASTSPSSYDISSQEIKESTMVYIPHPPKKVIQLNLRHLKREFSHDPNNDHVDGVHLKIRPLDLKRSRITCQQTLTPTSKYLSLMQDFFGDGDHCRGEGFKPRVLPEVLETTAGDRGEGVIRETERTFADCSEEVLRETREEPRQRGSAFHEANELMDTSVNALLKNDPVSPPENTSLARVQAARRSNKRKKSTTSRLA